MPKIVTFGFFLYALALSTFACNPAYGQTDTNKTRYVSDYLKINLKDRLDKPYEVIATVQSDDPVQLLEESDNYWKVATTDGKEGWIAKHYLKSELPKSSVIKQLRQEIADLKVQLSGLSGQPGGAMVATSPSCKELEEKVKNSDGLISSLQQKLAEAQTAQHSPMALGTSGSTSAETTPENHAWLVEEYEKRGEQIEELQKSIAKKEDRTRFLWFIAGALVFLVGLLAGKTGSRKKNKFSY